MEHGIPDRGEMPYYPSDADRLNEYGKTTNFDFEKEARKNEGGLMTWARRNWLKLIISTVIIMLMLLILSVVLYFCLRTLPKKQSCRKLFEIEIVSMAQYEFRIRWAPNNYADVEAKYFLEDLIDGTRIKKRKACNCSALSSFWKWWDKHYNHFNHLLRKFELNKNPLCTMIINREVHQNFQQSNTCTAVVLKYTTHGEMKELAFLAGDTGFLTVTASKRLKRSSSSFKFSEIDDVTRYLFSENDDVANKIENFFKELENEDARHFVMYYTKPLKYLKELTKEESKRNKEMSLFTPYTETGYYVSLPNLVYLEKISNSFLRAAKQLLVFAELITLDINEDELKIKNYHEAVRGITNLNLADYYLKILENGLEKSQELVTDALINLSVNESIDEDYMTCSDMAFSECFGADQWNEFILTIYNPLNHPISPYIRLPVSLGEYSIRAANGLEIPLEIKKIPLSIYKSVLKESQTEWELVFRAENIPGFGFKSYYVTLVYLSPTLSPSALPQEKIELLLDPTMQKWTGVKVGNAEYSLSSDVLTYESSFCGGSLSRYNIHEKPKEYSLPLRNGDLVMEYETFYDNVGSRIVRSFAGENYLEVEWIFEKLTDDFEIVTQYTADIASDGIFRIDGLERGSEEKISKNRECPQKCMKTGQCLTQAYYPVQEISINDSFTHLVIVSELPQSGISPCSGTIEFSVLTRSLDTTENNVVREKHWIFIGNSNDEKLQARAKSFAQEKKSDPLLFFMNAEHISFEDWQDSFTTEFSGLPKAVPENILVLTFEPRDKNTIWTRLQNTGDSSLRLALDNLFPENFEVKEIPFGSSRCLSQSKAPSGTLCNEHFEFQFNRGHDLNKTSSVEFFPFEIKSFILKRIS